MQKKMVYVTILALMFLFSLAGTALAADTNPTDGIFTPAGGETTVIDNATRLDPAAGGTNPTNVSGDNATGFLSPSVADKADPNYIKYDSPSNRVIHSNYSANTDACASCHTAHNGVNDMLLQWEDTQTACWACHDGTVTTTYNVAKGEVVPGKKTSAGLFGQTGSELGLSNHGMSPSDANAMKTAAAPGGAEDPAVKDKNGNWGTEFTCAACHEPHGAGGNGRILKMDVNGIATQNAVTNEVLTTADNIIYQAAKGNWVSGAYEYKKGTKVTVYDATGTALAAQPKYSINYRGGRVKFDSALDPTYVVKANYFPGIYVSMTVADKLSATEKVTYNSGMNKFCGACHTDYNNEGKVPVYAADGVTITGYTTGHAYAYALGDYRKAYRHSVGFKRNPAPANLKFEGSDNVVTCLTCHFAHGTDNDFAGGTFDDTTRTSALKRLPNMAVCETCHAKGAPSNTNYNVSW